MSSLIYCCISSVLHEFAQLLLHPDTSLPEVQPCYMFPMLKNTDLHYNKSKHHIMFRNNFTHSIVKKGKLVKKKKKK